MEKIKFDAERRTVIGKQAGALRRAGRLPAVIYGKGIESIPITLDMRDLSRALPYITSSRLVVINVGKEMHTALVRERQRHPVSGELLHVDFQAVSMTEKLRTAVRIEFSGEAPAVENEGGVLVSGVEQIDVEALPGDLPERIIIDVTGLVNVGDTLSVKDLDIPSGVTVLTDPEETIATVIYPTQVVEEEEEEEVSEFDMEEPELVERIRAEEEEEGE